MVCLSVHTAYCIVELSCTPVHNEELLRSLVSQWLQAGQEVPVKSHLCGHQLPFAMSTKSRTIYFLVLGIVIDVSGKPVLVNKKIYKLGKISPIIIFYLIQTNFILKWYAAQ